jgi:hypothetical protein
MTPKEKAKKLTFKFMKIDSDSQQFDEFEMKLFYAQRCALIAVDEVIQQWEVIDTYISDFGGKLNQSLKYWQEVKQEIEKL